jgi:hypothetical protein
MSPLTSPADARHETVDRIQFELPPFRMFV